MGSSIYTTIDYPDRNQTFCWNSLGFFLPNEPSVYSDLFLQTFYIQFVLAVTAVANGIQAWKTLEDPTDQIDLVLTEVVMPLLSGIGLLSKIMGHKTLKNIPVISKNYFTINGQFDMVKLSTTMIAVLMLLNIAPNELLLQ